MELIKYGHACVRLTEGTDTVVIDPGGLTPEPEAWRNAQAVLITHEHFDHFNRGILEAALLETPELRILTCAGVAHQLDAAPHLRERVEVLRDGQSTAVGHLAVAAVGRLHNFSHPDVDPVNNIGFHINDTVLHPGDALSPVPAPVLLAPGQAPWLTVPALIAYLRAVPSEHIFPVHDGLLNPAGLQVLDAVLDAESRGAGREIRRLDVGETVYL